MADGPRRLTTFTIVLVAAGIALVVSVAFAVGGDIATVFYVAPILLLGFVVIAAAIKTQRGKVLPAECESCGGLISPNAPYCKHCGAQR